MPLFKRTVTVAKINPSLDLRNDETLYTIGFGEVVRVTDKMREKMRKSDDDSDEIPNIIGLPVLEITGKFEVVPYRMGSKWELTVSENGELSLKEVK